MAGEPDGRERQERADAPASRDESRIVRLRRHFAIAAAIGAVLALLYRCVPS